MAESQTSEIWRVQIWDVLFMRRAEDMQAGRGDIVSPTWKNVGGRVPPPPPPDVRPCRQDVGRSPPERRLSVDRFTNYRPQTRKAPAPISTGFCTIPVCLLTGAGRFLITRFRRAPPEPRPKCDRANFKQKIRSTPWRIPNSATFGRSTISAGDRWILWRRHNSLSGRDEFHW